MKRMWQWGAAIAALVTFIATPVYDAFVKDGKLPTGAVGLLTALGDWFSALWEWLNAGMLLPHWFVLVVAVVLFALAAFGVWLMLPGHKATTPPQHQLLDRLSPVQLKVFMLIGLAADHGGVVTLGQVVRNETLTRNAANHALELLLQHDLIKYGCLPGEESYDLTSKGRALYLEREGVAVT